MLRRFFIVGIVTFACACASTPSAPEGPNLILISLDTVRADHTTPYGYTRDTTPHLNRLAQEGIVYEQVMSPSPWTLPAHVSMLTGQYPLRHGVHHKDHTLARHPYTRDISNPTDCAPGPSPTAGISNTVRDYIETSMPIEPYRSMSIVQPLRQRGPRRKTG